MDRVEKFSPASVENFNIDLADVENFSLDRQKKILEYDPERIQKLDHADRDMGMKESWSWILGIYLAIFTILMFLTLWFNGKWCLVHLEESTLNFLITVGFAKVIGVVWAIVSHLFPKK